METSQLRIICDDERLYLPPILDEVRERDKLEELICDDEGLYLSPIIDEVQEQKNKKAVRA
jgi:hypothetical protein